jgi:small GTP-binding protein
VRVALIGQPNCGKSTLFNQVAGYKAETGNFTGTTVTFTESKVRVGGQIVEVVDLPGTYALEGTNPAERESALYLGSKHVDVIVNVLDATHLAQGLELSLELLSLKKPLVIAMNMMDEASRLGLHIDGLALSAALGVPVLPLVASKGRGVKNLFLATLEAARQPLDTKNHLDIKSGNLGRHSQALELMERFTRRGEGRVSLRDRLDDVLLHPVWGYLILLLVLLAFFEAVYGIGQLIEPPLLAFFDAITRWMVSNTGGEAFLGQLVLGVMQGIAAGVAIVLPYLLPFLFGLGILEDVGYLPRVAFLMDALMHRMGLHGKAIVPFILGYGCNVPAVMATRTLEDQRERYLAAALATLVPCAARLAVVFGLVAFYLGPLAAFGLYVFNLFVIALTGRILTSLMPEDTPGLILEMPTYRIPTFRNVLGKAWFRVREFVVEAWPVLIAGSAVLAILNFFNAETFFNWSLRPLTWTLGLPSQVGVPLIFGILRKELSLVMLGQALGTVNFASVLTTTQMLTYTVFVMFYIPCLATLSVLRRELGTRAMLAITALTIVVALVAALVVRGAAVLIL